MVGATFWAILSQTHLVTLAAAKKALSSFFSNLIKIFLENRGQFKLPPEFIFRPLFSLRKKVLVWLLNP
jgi:hypothetical protein